MTFGKVSSFVSCKGTFSDLTPARQCTAVIAESSSYESILLDFLAIVLRKAEEQEKTDDTCPMR